MKIRFEKDDWDDEDELVIGPLRLFQVRVKPFSINPLKGFGSIVDVVAHGYRHQDSFIEFYRMRDGSDEPELVRMIPSLNIVDIEVKNQPQLTAQVINMS